MNEKNKFNWTNFLLAVNGILITGGILLFMDGKSDIKQSLNEVKTEVKEVRSEQINVRERLARVETKLKERNDRDN